MAKIKRAVNISKFAKIAKEGIRYQITDNRLYVIDFRGYTGFMTDDLTALDDLKKSVKGDILEVNNLNQLFRKYMDDLNYVSIEDSRVQHEIYRDGNPVWVEGFWHDDAYGSIWVDKEKLELYNADTYEGSSHSMPIIMTLVDNYGYAILCPIRIDPYQLKNRIDKLLSGL